jgi:hypothetical protein
MVEVGVRQDHISNSSTMFGAAGHRQAARVYRNPAVNDKAREMLPVWGSSGLVKCTSEQFYLHEGLLDFLLCPKAITIQPCDRNSSAAALPVSARRAGDNNSFLDHICCDCELG